MKLSVSLPDTDVEFLDEFARRSGNESRSSVVHQAILMLRLAELTDEYDEAFTEWGASTDAQWWDESTGDGISA